MPEMLSDTLSQALFFTEQIQCIQETTYYEARGESIEGWLGVINTIINRTLHPKFPNTPCEVTNAPWQFTYKWDRIPEYPPNTPADLNAWRSIRLIAIGAYISMLATNKNLYDNTGGALFYHSIHIEPPRWAKHPHIKKTKQIQRHIFYTLDKR